MRLIALLNIVISQLFGQENLDMLIQEVLSGSKDSAAMYLPMIEKQYPHNPNMLFLKGLMETNGEEAMQIFVELYNNHPSSEYGDDAVMKVAEFYYASGLYVQSAEWLKKMPLYYSRSEHIDRSVKLFLNSLIVSGNRDTAIFYARVFKKQFPYLDVDGNINVLLENYENSKLLSKDTINPYSFLPTKAIKTDQSSAKYSLQSGAFSSKGNAEKQRVYLISVGFNAQIAELDKNTKVLYAVRIGNYDTKKEAKAVGNKIKSMLDLDTIVVSTK